MFENFLGALLSIYLILGIFVSGLIIAAFCYGYMIVKRVRSWTRRLLSPKTQFLIEVNITESKKKRR